MDVLECETISSRELTSIPPGDDAGLLAGGSQRYIKLYHHGGGAPSDRFERLVLKLVGFQELRPNWDSYGAREPDRTVLQQTLDILDHLRSRGLALPSNLVPTNSGGTQLEWALAGGDMELEVQGDSHFALLLESDGEPKELELVGFANLMQCVTAHLLQASQDADPSG